MKNKGSARSARTKAKNIHISLRMAGKWTSGARQQKLSVPERTLYHAQWDAWVAVGET